MQAAYRHVPKYYKKVLEARKDPESKQLLSNFYFTNPDIMPKKKSGTSSNLPPPRPKPAEVIPNLAPPLKQRKMAMDMAIWAIKNLKLSDAETVARITEEWNKCGWNDHTNNSDEEIIKEFAVSGTLTPTTPPTPSSPAFSRHQPSPLHQPSPRYQPSPLHQPSTIQQPSPLRRPPLTAEPPKRDVESDEDDTAKLLRAAKLRKMARNDDKAASASSSASAETPNAAAITTELKKAATVNHESGLLLSQTLTRVEALQARMAELDEAIWDPRPNATWRQYPEQCRRRQASAWIMRELDRLSDFQVERLEEHVSLGKPFKKIAALVGASKELSDYELSLRGTQKELSIYRAPPSWVDQDNNPINVDEFVGDRSLRESWRTSGRDPQPSTLPNPTS